jgi:hypothetical protein
VNEDQALAVAINQETIATQTIPVTTQIYAYVTGYTLSPSFRPGDTGKQPYNPDTVIKDPNYTPPDNQMRVFVAKITEDGSNLVYLTYIVGNGNQAGNAIAVLPDPNGGAGLPYVAGYTQSSNWPLQNPIAGQPTVALGNVDAFVLELNAAGNGLVFSTNLGGPGFDIANGIALWTDTSNPPITYMFVTGSTTTSVQPGDTWKPFSVNAWQSTFGGGTYDAFVSEIAPPAQGAINASLVFSSYLGGTSSDQGFGIAVDSSGNAYVTGETYSPKDGTINPFSKNAWQDTLAGGKDAFITKVTPPAGGGNAAVVFSSYLGGTGTDSGRGISVTPAGLMYVAGYTSSHVDAMTMPARFNPGANQMDSDLYGKGGGFDAFVMRLSWNGATSTLTPEVFLSFGGAKSDQAFGIATRSGTAYVVGLTNSNGDPLGDGYPKLNSPLSYQGGTDAFVAAYDTTQAAGSRAVYNVYQGGSAEDVGTGVAVWQGVQTDPKNKTVFAVGYTASSDFLTADPNTPPNPFQQKYGGGTYDGFAVSIAPF